MEGPRVMNEDVFPQYQAREEGIIVSFDDAEWQLKKVNVELKKVNRELNEQRERLTRIVAGDVLSERAELKRVNRELNDLREIVTALQQGESLTDALGAVEERIYLEGAPLIDHLLKNDFWEDIDPDEWGVIYSPRKEEVSRLNLSELGEDPDDFVKLLEQHPYVDTVQIFGFGCVTVVTFHALGNTNDWHYKFDIYPGPTTHYVACRWTDEEYSG
jgi:predicted RNase H-like nuclease (RuvC/YqgF family)|tara:strand:+ start:2646 stop:3293 length:648 start_codon:yes stop_codon:yes gene_type:complete